jgi:hypothetical protein
MVQNNTQDQHFVPVCYLRNFSPESEQKKKNPKVWAYDKYSKSSNFKGAKSICYSNKLYSINRKSESLITNDIKDKETIFESHYLHDFEQEYSQKLSDAISSIKERKFGGGNKMDLSLFIVIQYLRDPIIKLLLDANEEIPYLALPEEYKLLSSKSPDLLNDSAMRHFMHAYGNKDAIKILTRSLATSVWTIHYNPNDVFYTSDNPVCLAQDKPSNQNDGDKVGKILHIVFPVSKNILLQITQGVQINEIYYIDNTPQWQIDNFNFIQAHFAKKYVISATDSFSTIKDRIEADPIKWDINKAKIYG